MCIRDRDDEEWRNLCKFDNPLIPNTSRKVKLECNQRYGRHIVASEDIEPGITNVSFTVFLSVFYNITYYIGTYLPCIMCISAEILSSEKFVSIEVHSSGLPKNCSYCAIGCSALIPCPFQWYVGNHDRILDS